MKLEKVYEVIAIKQQKRKSTKSFDEDSLIIRSPHDAYEIANKFIGDYAREVFLVLMLNTKNKVIAAHIAHIGSLNSSIVSPREVFQAAILNNAASIIVSHQHPSGDPSESREDIQVTKRLVECGKILGLEVLDHIICGDNRYVSHWPKKNLFFLYELGLLHDIGKLRISKEILNKPGVLTEEEKNEIYKHTVYGHELLEQYYPKEFLDGVLYHHENIDGTGYEKMKGLEIPFIAKVVRIIDSFDAMTNNRSYQKAMPISKALDEIESYKGIWYESSLVSSFVKMIKRKGNVNVF